MLNQQYPEHKGKMGGSVVDVKQYVYDDTIDVEGKSVVVDWYYKVKSASGKTVLHYVKFVGDTLLFASENDPRFRESGIYEHGMYLSLIHISFALAVERDGKNKETGERQTDFIDCVAWRNTAEFAAHYFSKGRMAVVEGRLPIRDRTDKDGHKRKSAEVLVGRLYFGDSKNSTGKEDPLDRLQRNAPGIVEQTEICLLYTS